MVVELAIARDTFGRDFADVEWGVLDKVNIDRLPKGSKAVEAFNEVAREIGISRTIAPRDVVRKMVAYFRAFAPSEQPPTGRGDIYLDLALSQKGVCRHRAFAFLVTSLGIGVPARMVVNEAHAWVEVFDAKLWHRIDLGGAAANLDTETDNQRPPYVPPPDPYAWPESRDSGQDLADRTRAQGPSGQAPGRGGRAEPDDSRQRAARRASPIPSPSKGPDSEVTVTAIDSDVRRGLPVHLQGVVMNSGAPCPHLRVDVHISGAALKHGALIGSLSTDERGKYDGAVVIPRDFSLGDYTLVVKTPGDARCGRGQTK